MKGQFPSGGYPQMGYSSNPYAQYYGGQPGMAAGFSPGQVAGQQAGYKMPSFQVAPQDVPGMLPLEQSYVENILRLNRGKLATVYMTFENNREWNAKIFKGIIEAAGRDHLILSDPQTGKRYLLLMVYLDYVTFDEEIDYDYPFGAAPGLSAYPPR